MTTACAYQKAITARPAPLLRFLTCGSVDNGKSTLIGRLLYDAGLLFQDQPVALDTRAPFADLLDGLSAEREQGITIDVAFRYFSTANRSFIVADAPGHEQYTRNMATGASVSDLALLLLDAVAGVQLQTRRHLMICHLFGIRHVVVVVNKMDLVGYEQSAFHALEEALAPLALRYGFSSFFCLPVSALRGENVCVTAREVMPWYHGPSLLSYLEDVDVEPQEVSAPFRFPVQWLCRPKESSFRGYAGTVASGHIDVGDEIVVLPSRCRTRVKSIVTFDGALDRAEAGQAVVMTLEEELDVGRGHVLSSPDAMPEVSDQWTASLVWMHEDPLEADKPYLLCCGVEQAQTAQIVVRSKLDWKTLEEGQADRLVQNDIGQVDILLTAPLVVEPFSQNKTLGCFILCDRQTHQTVAAGCVRSTLPCGSNVRWQTFAMDGIARARLKGQTPFCLWLTGLSGAGKSTLASLLEKRLYKEGCHTYVLDGDNLRHGLNRDLGFSPEDRAENVRRVAEVARLMVDAGLIVLVAFISPFRAQREKARSLFPPGSFYEVYVDAPLSVCEKRDSKGLYKKARQGLIPDFTGVSSPYEAPEAPDFYLESSKNTPEEMVARILERLRAQGSL